MERYCRQSESVPDRQTGQAGRQAGRQRLLDNGKGTQTEQVPYLQKNAVFSARYQFQEQVC